jgi:Family of unknown function (DUF6090)
MIKFFRKTRQQMINENKTSKYLKYAIGEIVLVVIGILIALSINNWNETRKATNEETKILIALQADFKTSKTRIEKTIVRQQRVLDYSKILINIHERKDDKEFEYFDTHLDSLNNLIAYGTTWYRTEPVTGAYNALISAGKVDLIKNEKLRHLLAQFFADLESGFEDQETAMDLLSAINKQLGEVFLKISSNKVRDRFQFEKRKYDTLQISKKIFKNNSFFGNLFKKHMVEYNRLRRQQRMLEQTNAILEIIDQKLEK